MADDTDDVLELDTDLELEEQDGEEQTDGELTDEESEQDFGFGEDEAAPAQESSVIRELRKANRELAKQVSKYERDVRPQIIEVGEKPTLASCDWDEARFETELDQWKSAIAERDRIESERISRAEADRKSWQAIRDTYEAEKSTLKVADYADAEDEVFTVLPDEHQALLMKSGKGAQLVVALSRDPKRLQELSEMNLADAAMMIGELRGKLQMRTRPPASPERRVTGNTGFTGGTDKQLAKLKAKAEQSGDYTEYLAAKRNAKG